MIQTFLLPNHCLKAAVCFSARPAAAETSFANAFPAPESGRLQLTIFVSFQHRTSDNNAHVSARQQELWRKAEGGAGALEILL